MEFVTIHALMEHGLDLKLGALVTVLLGAVVECCGSFMVFGIRFNFPDG